MARKQLAEKIKILRNERSWSQALLAENARLSLRTIQRLEKEGHCSHETLLAVAGAFDIDVRNFTHLINRDSLVVQERDIYETKWIEFSVPGMLSRLASRVPKINKRFSNNMAALGLALLIIPVFFALTGILKYSLGFDGLPDPFNVLKSIPLLYPLITSPFFLLGSLALALILNVVPLIDFVLKKKPDELIGSFSIKGSKWNALMAATSLFFMTLMMGYAVVENIPEQATQQEQQADTNNSAYEAHLLDMQNKLDAHSEELSMNLMRIVDIQMAQQEAYSKKEVYVVPHFSDFKRISENMVNEDRALYETLQFYGDILAVEYDAIKSRSNGTESSEVLLEEVTGLVFVDKGEAMIQTYGKLVKQLQQTMVQEKDFVEFFDEAHISEMNPGLAEKLLRKFEAIALLKESNLKLLQNLRGILQSA